MKVLTCWLVHDTHTRIHAHTHNNYRYGVKRKQYVYIFLSLEQLLCQLQLRAGPLLPYFVIGFYSSWATVDGTRAGHLTHDLGHSDSLS